MQVRHNTVLLDRAFEHVVRQASIPLLQAEADALVRANRSIALKRFATGASIALIAVALIAAAAFFFQLPPQPLARLAEWPGAPTKHQGDVPAPPQQEAKPHESSAPSRQETRSREPSTPPQQDTRVREPFAPPQQEPRPREPSAPPTTDFTKFVHREGKLRDKTFRISAGHHFASEEAKSWQRGWCYTLTIYEGVPVQLELAVRDGPSDRPFAPSTNLKTLQRLGLTVGEALHLAAQCSWLDREFTLDELRKPAQVADPLGPGQLQTSLTGRKLSVAGAIGRDFTQVVSSFDFDVLEIDSSGGLLSQALATGRLLRAQVKDVQVSGKCLSACIYVLAGGTYRDATSSAQIGVHRFVGLQPSDDDVEVTQQVVSEIVAYLSEMGVSVALYHATATVPSDSMKYLSRSDMEAWKLINGQRPPLTQPAQTLSTSAPQLNTKNERSVARSQSGWTLTYSSDLLTIVPNSDDRYDAPRQTYDTAWTSKQHGNVDVFVQVSANAQCRDAEQYSSQQLRPRRAQVDSLHSKSNDPQRTAYTMEGRTFDGRAFFDWVSVRRDDRSTIVHVGGRFPPEYAEFYRAEIKRMLDSMDIRKVEVYKGLCPGFTNLRPMR